jgi:ketosteroid isomerase-like protein
MTMNSRVTSSRACGAALAFGLLAAAPMIGSSAEGQSDAPSPNAALLAANEAFYAAVNQVLAGDVSSMEKVWSQHEAISDFGPFGEMLDGWPQIEGRFSAEESDARKAGIGRVACENTAVFMGDQMGVVTCTEAVTKVTRGGRGTTFRIRATNVFVKEDGAWKMVHHHADASLAADQKP